MARQTRGFTLLETLIALSLVSVSMTGLVVALGSSSKYGALARRQATAMTVARSQVETLSHAPYNDATDLRLANTNTGNDGGDAKGTALQIADPAGKFASATVPGGTDAPDFTFPNQVQVGDEKYDVFVNVRPVADPVNGTEMGKQIAVIVRYKVGAQWMRAVALGYRYNPAVVGVADGLPL
jgi:prepilin-type N-terminal cleavage/methylation domain-containing protein